MSDRSKGNRPLDILQKSLGKNILLRLRSNRELRGILRSYDPHLNLYIENAVLLSNSEESQDEELGRIILRGDNVIMISPS
ncbi:MAG: LSM domain-containing protein [Candidatus Hodarchaeales archaeon]